MKIHNLLQNLGIYYEKGGEDGAGGGEGGSSKTMSPEEYTNRKLGGEAVEKPEGGEEKPPKKSEEGGGETKPEKKEEPAGEEKPAKKKEEAAGEEKPEGGEAGEEAGEGGEGEEFFYDPEKHVEGEPAHSNKFPTREKAEFAAINKADMLRQKLEEMKEDGVDRGAIPLPKALNGNPDEIENMTDLEIVHSMSDDELRTFLNESDASRQRLDSKHNRVKQAKQVETAKNEFEQVQVDLYNDLKKFMEPDEIEQNLAKFSEPEAAKEFVNSRINEKIKNELAEDRQALEDWIDKVDSGEINLSIKEYDEEKDRRLQSIADKRQKLEQQYKPAVEKLDRAMELAETVETEGGNKEVSPQQKAKNMRAARDEMEKDLEGDLPLLADNSDARAEYVAAQKWAIQNASDFNDLQHPSDWAKALRKGWPEHKNKVRSSKQRQQIEGEQGESGQEGSGINKPGDQSKLEGIEARDVRQRNRKALDKLEEMTNAKVGV